MEDLKINIKEELCNLKLDWTNICCDIDYGTSIYHDFELNPSDYINFSTIDIKTNDTRGLLNSITNSKRAIDCQIDKIFMSLGYQFDSFPKYLTNFCDYFCTSQDEKKLPLKLKTIVAFDFAPCGLVSEIRNLRNQIEHYYIKPTYDEARKAIEVATLFIRATEMKLKNVWSFRLYNKKNKEKSIRFDFDSGKIKIHIKNGNSVNLQNDTEVYAILFKLSMLLDQEESYKETIHYLTQILEIPIPYSSINIEFI